jgi:NADP-dependent alcohol dehydrogenase
MFNFDYYNPTHIVFGKDRLADLDKLVPKDARVLVTYGGGSAKKSGLLAKVVANLGKRHVAEFGGIEPNPKFETAMKAVAVVAQEKIDFLLAVGGGSVIDGTKFIALAARCTGNPEEILKHGFMGVPAALCPAAVPFGTVLTLPATGSEMNSGAVISFGHEKLAVMSGLTFPVFSILDPTYTATLPAIQVANGIVDAFVHTVEQYLTFPAEGRVQDRMAEGILLTLVEIGRKSVDEPDNYDVRANHVWAATTALNGFIAVGVPQDWATHMIGHELTALFGIDHGQTLAVVYPSLLEVRRDKKKAKLVQYAERVWNVTTGTDDQKITTAIGKTREFFESLGIKTRLSAYGVKRDQIGSVVQALKDHGMTRLSETGDLTPDISEKILANAF